MYEDEHSFKAAPRCAETQDRQRPLRRGDVLAGRYKVIDSLGHGGMATVFLAKDLTMRRQVVLKLPRTDKLDQGASVQILQEKRALSALAHPSIVSIFDVGVDAGQPFLVLEYLQGRTVLEVVAAQGALSPTRAITMALAVAEGVAALHERGLLHLDLTAANVMLTDAQDGAERTRVIDFGLAISRSAARTRKLVGTPHYLAPEQILGHDVGAQADVYALGVLLYFALCGSHPFEGDDQRAILKKQLRGAPPSLRQRLPAGAQVPRRLLGLVDTCLAKDPNARFEGLGVVIEVLRELLHDGDKPAAVPKNTVRTGPAPRSAASAQQVAGSVALVAAPLVGMGVASGSISTFFFLVTAAALGAVTSLHLTGNRPASAPAGSDVAPEQAAAP